MLPVMTSKLLLMILVLIPALATLAAQQTPLPIQDGQIILLWQGRAPGALGTEDSDIPAITAFLPRTMAANTPAVIVCPGGGYVSLASNHEGPAGGELSQLVGNCRLCVAIAAWAALPPSYRVGRRATRDSYAAGACLRMANRSGANRHHGFLSRRTFGNDCQHAF